MSRAKFIRNVSIFVAVCLGLFVVLCVDINPYEDDYFWVKSEGCNDQYSFDGQELRWFNDGTWMVGYGNPLVVDFWNQRYEDGIWFNDGTFEFDQNVDAESTNWWYESYDYTDEGLIITGGWRNYGVPVTGSLDTHFKRYYVRSWFHLPRVPRIRF